MPGMLPYDAAVAADLLRRRRPFSGGNGGARIAPDGGRAPSTIQPPPWITMPSGGFPFDFQNMGQVLMPAIGVEVTVLTFTVPPGLNGAIVSISNQFVGGGWVEGTGDIAWRIEADSVPARNYESIIASLGSMAIPGDLRTRPIRIFENQVIALIVLNNPAGATGGVIPAGQALNGRLGGWFYPIEQEGVSYWI